MFLHLPSELRTDFYQKLADSLKPGGKIFLEGFSKEQLGLTSGGPKDLNLLFSVEELEKDFSMLNILSNENAERILNEGNFHSGNARLVQLIAEKPEK